jgi:hypothetical protein
MSAPVKIKVRMLSELLGQNPDLWTVVGITEEALNKFKQHDFKKVSKMDINRSHIVDRHKTYATMLTGDLMDCDTWWSFYIENDKTILATRSENKSGRLSKIFDIDPSLNLFKSQGFAWKHTKAEYEYLRNIYLKNA